MSPQPSTYGLAAGEAQPRSSSQISSETLSSRHPVIEVKAKKSRNSEYRRLRHLARQTARETTAAVAAWGCSESHGDEDASKKSRCSKEKGSTDTSTSQGSAVCLDSIRKSNGNFKQKLTNKADQLRAARSGTNNDVGGAALYSAAATAVVEVEFQHVEGGSAKKKKRRKRSCLDEQEQQEHRRGQAAAIGASFFVGQSGRSEPPAMGACETAASETDTTLCVEPEKTTGPDAQGGGPEGERKRGKKLGLRWSEEFQQSGSLALKQQQQQAQQPQQQAETAGPVFFVDPLATERAVGQQERDPPPLSAQTAVSLRNHSKNTSTKRRRHAESNGTSQASQAESDTFMESVKWKTKKSLLVEPSRSRLRLLGMHKKTEEAATRTSTATNAQLIEELQHHAQLKIQSQKVKLPERDKLSTSQGSRTLQREELRQVQRADALPDFTKRYCVIAAEEDTFFAEAQEEGRNNEVETKRTDEEIGEEKRRFCSTAVAAERRLWSSLHPCIVRILQQRSIRRFFPVQRTVIDLLLQSIAQPYSSSRSCDACVAAPTGEGKTLCYVLPIVSFLLGTVVPATRCLVLTPTRELAAQVAAEFRRFSHTPRASPLHAQTVLTPAASAVAQQQHGSLDGSLLLHEKTPKNGVFCSRFFSESDGASLHATTAFGVDNNRHLRDCCCCSGRELRIVCLAGGGGLDDFLMMPAVHAGGKGWNSSSRWSTNHNSCKGTDKDTSRDFSDFFVACTENLAGDGGALASLPPPDVLVCTPGRFSRLVADALQQQKQQKNEFCISKLLASETHGKTAMNWMTRTSMLQNIEESIRLDEVRWVVIDEADRLLRQSYNDWTGALTALQRMRSSFLGSPFATAGTAATTSSNTTVDASSALSAAASASHSKTAFPLLFPARAGLSIQKLIFSATMTKSPRALAALNLTRPLFLLYSPAGRYTMPSRLAQRFVVCKEEDKPLCVLLLLHAVASALLETVPQSSAAAAEGSSVLRSPDCRSVEPKDTAEPNRGEMEEPAAASTVGLVEFSRQVTAEKSGRKGAAEAEEAEAARSSVECSECGGLVAEADGGTAAEKAGGQRALQSSNTAVGKLGLRSGSRGDRDSGGGDDEERAGSRAKESDCCCGQGGSYSSLMTDCSRARGAGERQASDEEDKQSLKSEGDADYEERLKRERRGCEKGAAGLLEPPSEREKAAEEGGGCQSSCHEDEVTDVQNRIRAEEGQAPKKRARKGALLRVLIFTSSKEATHRLTRLLQLHFEHCQHQITPPEHSLCSTREFFVQHALPQQLLRASTSSSCVKNRSTANNTANSSNSYKSKEPDENEEYKSMETEKVSLRIRELSSNVPQRMRDKVFNKFRRGQVNVLVCSDVAARGLDVEGVQLVLHYDAPQQLQAYVHRSGRSARAHAIGVTVTLLTPSQVLPFRELLKRKKSDLWAQLAQLRVKLPNASSKEGNSFRQRYSELLLLLRRCLSLEAKGRLNMHGEVPDVDQINEC